MTLGDRDVQHYKGSMLQCAVVVLTTYLIGMGLHRAVVMQQSPKTLCSPCCLARY